MTATIARLSVEDITEGLMGCIREHIAPEGTSLDASSRLIGLLRTDALGPNAGLVKFHDFVSKTYGISRERLIADYHAGKFAGMTLADSANYICAQVVEARA